MSNFKKKHPMPEKGQIVEVTARKCGDKQQPLLQVGKAYIVESVATLQDGTPVVEVAHPKRRKATLRMNAQRFDWQIVTPEMAVKREKAKLEEETDHKLQTDFTLEEQVQIAFIPLVIENLVWVYADKCIAYAVENRIDVLKKLTRAARHVQNEYVCFQKQSLDSKHIEKQRSDARKFIEACGNDFTIMYFTVNREYKRTNPDAPHGELATNALIGMLLIRFLDAWNRKIDGMIEERLGKAMHSVRTPTMEKLYAILDAYAGNLGAFDITKPDIALCLQILKRKIEQADFEVVQDQ